MKRRAGGGLGGSRVMPTIYGKYVPPPAIVRHRRLWLALLDAVLPAADLPGYSRALTSLYVRFLDERAVPTFEAFSIVTEQLLADLRNAAYDDQGQYVDDGRYLRAARHLQLAERLARDQLMSDSAADP